MCLFARQSRCHTQFISPFVASVPHHFMLCMVSGGVLFLSDWTRTPYNHIYLGIGIVASGSLNFSRSFCLQFYVNYTI